MDFTIVICSHNRIQILQQKTLAALDRYNIPPESVAVFVAPEEKEAYQQAFPFLTIHTGALGLAENRSAAIDFFPEETKLVFLDDDIGGFYTILDGHLQPLENLTDQINTGFALTEKHKASLWSFYPVLNGGWMSHTYSVGLVFCYGCCYGVINRRDTRALWSLKEDYERSMRFYLRDGAVVRINWVAPLQKYKKTVGGLSEYRTVEKERDQALKLVTLFPQLCAVKNKKDQNRWDLCFKRNLARKIPWAGCKN